MAYFNIFLENNQGSTGFFGQMNKPKNRKKYNVMTDQIFESKFLRIRIPADRKIILIPHTRVIR